MKRPPEAYRGPRLFEAGMGHVIIARFKAGGLTEAGLFLVDAWCLGVKDADFLRLDVYEYENDLLEQVFSAEEGGAQKKEPACARKLVEEAVAYARSLGLEPHPDYRRAARVFGGIQGQDCAETFVFGKDGRPFYFQGPHDRPEDVLQRLLVLQHRLGPDKFHYVITPDVGDYIVNCGYGELLDRARTVSRGAEDAESSLSK